MQVTLTVRHGKVSRPAQGIIYQDFISQDGENQQFPHDVPTATTESSDPTIPTIKHENISFPDSRLKQWPADHRVLLDPAGTCSDPQYPLPPCRSETRIRNEHGPAGSSYLTA